MAAVLFYISGHGFGHASREIEIVNALGRLRPDLDLVVRTSAKRWLFERTVDVPFAFLEAACDTGVVQPDSLRLDERATIERAAGFHATLDARAAGEAAFLRARGARFVIADAPPLACLAAAEAGVPAVVVANFTWDWIYQAYAEHLSRAPWLLESIRGAYRRARGAWRLPLHGGFEAFDAVVDVPMVARRRRHDRATVRRLLDLPASVPLALASFGGLGIAGLDVARLDCLSDCDVVLTGESEAAPRSRGVHIVDERTLYGRGLRYEDLVGAVDVVVTKPGYGIIAECTANDSAILYTSRGRFPEYDVLIREMPRFVRCRYIPQDELFAGGWREPIEALLSSPAPVERPATDGAEVIARMVAERC